MPRTRFFDLILLCGSLVLSLVIVEIFLRVAAPQEMSGSVYEYAPRGYPVNKSHGSALYSVGPHKGRYHFTKPHLRGASSAPAGAKRILVLGDSFTFGVGLPEEDTYVARLQTRIDDAFGAGRIALLNAGIGGSGTAEHLAFLEDFGSEIAPAIVILFVGIDDFPRAARSSLYRLTTTNTFELTSGSVATYWLKELVVGSDLYNFVIEHVHIAQLIRRTVITALYFKKPEIRTTTSPEFPSAPDEGSEVEGGWTNENKKLARALFRRMKTWCDAHGARIAVINNGWQAYDSLIDMLKSENIIAYDAAPELGPELARDKASLIIPIDGHPNAKGAALIADAVWPFVRDIIDERR